MGAYLDLLSFGPGGWGALILQGTIMTVALAVATLPFGLALGLAIALAARSHSAFWRSFATIYTTIFRGVPELLTLYIVYYGMQTALQKLWKGLSLPGTFEMNSFAAGMFALGVVLSAFSAEVWVGALNSIHRGQRDAASALGLSKKLAFRLVILPQLFRVALPGIGNNWLVLLKETSLVSTIALADLMFVANRANVVTKKPFLFFGVACLIYLLFSGISTAIIGRLEARANRGFAGHG
jgi:polar amino acid transport system permease protein